MAGVKGRSGGKRPGSGRKPDAIRKYQEQMREAARACVTEDDVRTMMESAISRAKAGDDRARQFVSDWVLGKVPDEVKQDVNLTGDLVIRVVYADADA